MSHKNQPSATSARGKKTPAASSTAGADDSQVSDEESKLRAIGGRIVRPGRLRNVHDTVYESFKALAEGIVRSVGDELGGQNAKPRVRGIDEQFIDHWGSPPEIDETVKERMLQPDHIVSTSMLDREFDKSVANALSKFDKASTKAASEVQTAYDNWTHAMRLYESVSRSASDVFIAQVEALTGSSDQSNKTHYNDEEQVIYFTVGGKIADALHTYESDMTKATVALSAALADLINARFGSWASLAMAEVDLIKERQVTSQHFWSGINKELSKR